MQTEARESDHTAAAAAAAASATAATVAEDSSDNWEVVHVTPATAECDLANITTPRCFVLHSTTGFHTPLPLSLHTAAAAAAASGINGALYSGSTDAGGTASATLPPHSCTSSLPYPRDKTAVDVVREEAGAESAQHAENSCAAAEPSSCDLFGAYRRVRVIHNTAPCLISCATEFGSPPPPSNCIHTDGSTPLVSGVPPLVRTGSPSSQPSSSSCARQRAQPQPSSSSSLLQTSLHSMRGFFAALGSPLSPPLPAQQDSSAFLTATAATGATGGPRAAPPSASPPLSPLANVHAQSAARRVSKAPSSPRRSHPSSSTLAETVIFIDPLEIIAEAAISFVDVVFAAHVSVTGSGTVQFVNCCFGHRSTSQLCQQFVSNPLTSDTGVSAKTDSGATRQHACPTSVPAGDLMQLVTEDVNNACVDSSDDPGQLSGWAAPVASAVDHASLLSSEDHGGSGNKPSLTDSKPLEWTSPLKNEAESNSGVFGPNTGFALPTTMRMMSMRQRSSLASNVSGPPALAEPPKGNANSNTNTSKGSRAAAPLNAAASTLGTMAGITDSAATSVLDVHGGSYCVLNQCDLYGGCAGASLVCRDNSHSSVTDCSFDGPSITWAAIEVRDTAEATIQYTNIRQVMGVGVFVSNHGRATVDSSVIERCGIAGVVATDYGTVSLQNTGVEASVSGVCVSLSCSAEAQMIGCGFTTRFTLPRRAAGLMLVEHLHSLGALRPVTDAAGTTSPARDSILSSVGSPLLQHALHADLESLLCLWLLHIGASAAALPTSSQSLVLCDHAVAVVAECEFTCAIGLPRRSLPPATANAKDGNVVGTHDKEENASFNGSHADRSNGAMQSLSGFPPVAVQTGGGADLKVPNALDLVGSSGNNNPLTVSLSGSSVTRRVAAEPDESEMRRSLTHVAMAKLERAEDGVDDDGAPRLSDATPHASCSSVRALASTGVAARAASSSLLSGPGRAVLSAATTMSSASAADDPRPFPTPTSCAGSGFSPLPLPVRRVIAGLLSSYVMAREVFGEYLGDKRRLHAAERAVKNSATGVPSPLSSSKKTDVGSVSNARQSFVGERTCTELFLSFEALTEMDNKEDDEDASAVGLGLNGERSATSRRLSTLSTAAMLTLQQSLHQLGCLPVLMAPNGGVYHIVASNQASLVLTSSVLSLALPPQLMVTLPSAWASAASYYVRGADAFPPTIRTTAAPLVAAVLDYHEPDGVSPHADRHERDRAARQRKNAKEPQERVNPFCSIYTRSNVIQYECVSMTSAQAGFTRQVPPHGSQAPSARAAGGASQQQQQQEEDAEVGKNAAVDASSRHGNTIGARNESGDAEDAEAVAAATQPHSALVGGPSGGGDHNDGWPTRRSATDAAGVAEDAGKSPPPLSPPTASSSAVQYPLPHAPMQRQSPDPHGAPPASVEFNTAAWGLVLITPQAARHSEALDKAVRMQAEHWCRVEQTASASTTAAATPATVGEGPLQIPAPLWRSNSKGAGRPSSPASTSAPVLTAGTTADTQETASTSSAQVHRLGNIFLNMANPAELLSVTHPEHICSAFPTFANVMELPAAQHYPVYPAQGPPSSNTAQRAASSHHGTNATMATAAISSPVNVPATTDFVGGVHRHPSEVGRTTTTAAANDFHSPTASAVPGTPQGEREMGRLHVNADMQRQMLLDDVDAPPFLAAAAAAAGCDEASGGAPNTQSPTHVVAGRVSQPAERTKVGVSHFSSTVPPSSNRSSAMQERTASAVTATVTKSNPLSMGEGEEEEEREGSRSMKITKFNGPNAQTSAHRSNLSSRASSQRGRLHFPEFPAGSGSDTDDFALLPTDTGAIQPPSSPQLSILDVESVGSSSTSSSRSTSSRSSRNDGDSNGGGGGQGSNPDSGDRRQPEKRPKWTLRRERSASNSHDAAEVTSASEGGKQMGGKEATASHREAQRRARPCTMRSDPSFNAGSENGEGDASQSESSSGSGSEAPGEKNEDVAEVKKQRYHNKAKAPTASPHPPPHSTARRPSASLSKSALQPQSMLPLPVFQRSPSKPELNSFARPSRGGPPLVDRAESLHSSPSSKSRLGTVSSLSSYSSKHDRHDSRHRLRQRRIPRATVQSSFSPSETPPRGSPTTSNTTSSSHLHHNPLKEERGAVEAAATAATAAERPVALGAAMERMAQLEDQLLQMQRILMQQQTQVSQMHSAILQSSGSQPEMGTFDTQSSLFALPFTAKTPIDAAGQAWVTARDSRRTQSDSNWNSFSNSKLQQPATPHRTPNTFAPHTLSLHITAAETAPVDEETKQNAGGKTPAVPPPAPPPRQPLHHSERAENEEGKLLTAAEDNGTAAAPASSGKAAKSSSSNSSSNNQSNKSVATTSTSARAPNTPQHPLNPPTEATPPQMTPTAAAAAVVVMDPSPPRSPPPNLTQVPPLRARVRRPSTGTTVDLFLLAAAQHSRLGTLAAAQGAAGETVEGANLTGYNNNVNNTIIQSLSAPQYSTGAEDVDEDAAADEEEEERRWEEELLRRLQTIHRGNTGADGRGRGERWRERFPFPTSARSMAAAGGGPSASNAGRRDHAGEAAIGEGENGAKDDAQEEEMHDGVFADHDALPAHHPSSPTVAYEPWRTTVATGTRYAHRPPPHPYCAPHPSSSARAAVAAVNNNVSPDRVDGNGDAGEQPPLRWREPAPPPALHTPWDTAGTYASSSSPRSPRAPRPHRPNSTLVPPTAYAETANAAPLSPTVFFSPLRASNAPTATTTMTSPTAYGAGGCGPPGLYLCGRRRSGHPRSPTQPASPPHLQQPPPSQQQRTTPATPHLPPSSRIAHLHEDYIHDQYARAAWDAVLTQSRAREREGQRLTSLRQSGQVHRLYTGPVRERVYRASVQARPSREQLYRRHGCTFTPKINQAQNGPRRTTLQNGTPRGPRNRPQRGAGSPITPAPVSSALPSHNTTMTCDDTTSSINTQRSHASQRGRPPPR
ncbi:hypothetical protein ABB37_06214 [Leptomonas pyrrhocoris]|uniref:Right handed beta helix domain-containing protein n=1 Tax=Leptomonas pyrrhocoris TaxID=157538 RepID=A0A0N0DU99_LEPPY|nr:hypothetical protein ABB37_06214 [Leptomonas pyrrhocoris]KPA78614.1 hypothetical protein ABB37_06214 [Leptomonas pyrrhocoris]|eukprot:XP_015657053.1 hypothetical protein ABB37_06214 [Leptomonas pyrrhocoris]